MRRFVILALLLLAACSTTPAVTPVVSPTLPDLPVAEPIPPLRTAFLGETLRLQGQLSNQLPNHLRNETLALVLDVPGGTPPHQVVGTLRTNGAFDVEATSPPPPTATPDQAFSRLPLGAWGPPSCEPEALEVSDASARVFVAEQLSLRFTAARPLLSPMLPQAGLTRTDWNAQTKVHLVYADRDVLVRGQKACRYERWNGGGSTPNFALFAVGTNLDLRRGWNEVRIAERAEYQNGLSTIRRVVSGNDPANSPAWMYGGSGMPVAPVSLP